MKASPKNRINLFLPLKKLFKFPKKTDHFREELNKYIQELKDSQVQLIQADKLSIIGERVSSILHDMNNPLTVISGYTNSLKELCQKTGDINKSDMEAYLSKISRGVEKINSLVDHVRSFSRMSNQQLIETNLNDVINNAFLMVETELKSANIKVVKELASTLPKILGDPNELEQVIINLISNAKDSMTDRVSEKPDYQPELVIFSRNIENGAEIIIRDNGKGIPEEIREKIFKPFFTTKEYGKGTGLGLSISYNIITKHGAKISVDSKPGAATSFTLTFNSKIKDVSA